MKEEITYHFSIEKNQWLKQERSISFEEIIATMTEGCLIEAIKHPNNDKYPNQEIYVLNIEGYVYLVPFVKRNGDIFLKTIFKSRKMTKEYLEQKK